MGAGVDGWGWGVWGALGAGDKLMFTNFTFRAQYSYGAGSRHTT